MGGDSMNDQQSGHPFICTSITRKYAATSKTCNLSTSAATGNLPTGSSQPEPVQFPPQPPVQYPPQQNTNGTPYTPQNNNYVYPNGQPQVNYTGENGSSRWDCDWKSIPCSNSGLVSLTVLMILKMQSLQHVSLTFGQIAEIVDNGQTSCATSGLIYGCIAAFIGVPCIMSCSYRTKIRSRYGIMETPAPDWTAFASGVHFARNTENLNSEDLTLL